MSGRRGDYAGRRAGGERSGERPREQRRPGPHTRAALS
ncbi:hypothetical protein GLE_0315 [Lysobacter enzymogenes]|uniref:Uncharacterized protein n=1 Tax=Lysobacter enzymogenes TaxID=69 RepID=A0A0S2DAW4_LYSEN|nr:hypothetical protein GLE_0315 [Lysobacter enzymogenes]